jgi:hypothetical protein
MIEPRTTRGRSPGRQSATAKIRIDCDDSSHVNQRRIAFDAFSGSAKSCMRTIRPSRSIRACDHEPRVPSPFVHENVAAAAFSRISTASRW